MATRRWAALAYRPRSRWLDLSGLVPSFLDELLTGLGATAELGGRISFAEIRSLVYIARGLVERYRAPQSCRTRARYRGTEWQELVCRSSIKIILCLVGG